MLNKTAPGLLLAFVVAVLAFQAAESPVMQRLGFSALTLSIIAGMVLGNTLYRHVARFCGDGIAFSKQAILRLGIILFGFKLTMSDIASVGWAGVGIDATVLSSTFLLAYWVGHKVLGMDRQSTILIGAGSAICGAAAVLATESVVKAHADRVAVAIATVVVFGTAAMFLWPAGYGLLRGYGISEHQFGVFTGSTIHEVAQAVVAGRSVGDEAMNTAVITKMIRVMMLAPFLTLLSAWQSRRSGSAAGQESDSAIAIPWFAILFLLVAAMNSLALFPSAWVRNLVRLDNLLLAIAMAALGMTTHIAAIRHAGVRPLLLALILFGWLIVGGALINTTLIRIFS